MTSDYEYRPGQIEEFVAWLAANGAEMRDLTNGWEVARWYANGVAGVVYVNKRKILSFSNAAANGVWKMFIRGLAWSNHEKVKKSAPAPMSHATAGSTEISFDPKSETWTASAGTITKDGLWTPPWDTNAVQEVTSHRSIDLDEAYMQMAEVWAKRSHANRLQVGALIVKDKQIISDGYNGMPAGSEDEVCEFLADRTEGERRLITKSEVLHAESNAISKLARHGGMGALGATMYVTHAPCLQCAKLIVQSGITMVYYRNTYRSEEGLEMLSKFGVTTCKLTEPQ